MYLIKKQQLKNPNKLPPPKKKHKKTPPQKHPQKNPTQQQFLLWQKQFISYSNQSLAVEIIETMFWCAHQFNLVCGQTGSFA